MRSKEKLYKIYYGIKYRCYNKNCKDYKYYGEKGIKISNEWNTYEKFKQWSLENGYKEGLCLDRINPRLDYGPFNCQWITNSENSKRMNIYYNGSPSLGRNLTEEHKKKCSISIKKRYNSDPSYKEKIKHTRATNGNTKITVHELEHLKQMKQEGKTRNEMYNYVNCKVNRNYFNALIRTLK